MEFDQLVLILFNIEYISSNNVFSYYYGIFWLKYIDFSFNYPKQLLILNKVLEIY